MLRLIIPRHYKATVINRASRDTVLKKKQRNGIEYGNRPHIYDHSIYVKDDIKME